MAKYNQDTLSKLHEAISTGSTISDACEFAAIGESTFYDWKSQKPEFSEYIKKAETARDTYTAELAKKTIVRAMQSGTWQAAAWWLERKHRKEFGKESTVNINNQEKPMTEKELEDEIKKLLSETGTTAKATRKKPAPKKKRPS